MKPVMTHFCFNHLVEIFYPKHRLFILNLVHNHFILLYNGSSNLLFLSLLRLAYRFGGVLFHLSFFCLFCAFSDQKGINMAVKEEKANQEGKDEYVL